MKTAYYAALLTACLVLVPLIGQAQITLFGGDPVFNAIEENDHDALSRALLSGTYSNGRDGSGRTPLIAAAQLGRSEMALDLIAAGALINDTDRTGNTALAWAASTGNERLLVMLIQSGAGINTQNRQGMTPLMMAAREGHVRVVESLIGAGSRTDILDYTGRSAADWARESRSSRIERLLN